LKHREEGTTKQKVVVFLPGRDGNCGTLIPLIKNISQEMSRKGVERGADWQPQLINLGNMRDTSLDEDIKKLRTALGGYPDTKIIIVGLSKGGLVALKYITSFDDPRIKKIITISSPLQGTQIASIFPHHSLIYKELSFNNGLITELLSKPIKIPLYHIVPQWDHIIIPGTAARHPRTPDENVYIYKGYNGHIGITHSLEVAAVINQWLSK